MHNSYNQISEASVKPFSPTCVGFSIYLRLPKWRTVPGTSDPVLISWRIDIEKPYDGKGKTEINFEKGCMENANLQA